MGPLSGSRRDLPRLSELLLSAKSGSVPGLHSPRAGLIPLPHADSSLPFLQAPHQELRKLQLDRLSGMSLALRMAGMGPHLSGRPWAPGPKPAKC